MNVQKVMLSVGLFLLRTSIVVLVIVGIYKLGEYAYNCGYSIVADTAAEPEPGRDLKVTLTSDMSVKETAQLLERRGLVHSADIFQIQLKINKYEDSLKPGEYILNTSMTPKELMQVMAGEVEEEDEDKEE